MKKCPNCNLIYTDNDFYCLKCNHKLELLSNTTREPKQEFVPKCPTCGSTSVEKISLTQKAVGGALFGLFSSNVRNTMHCKNCGYKW